MIVHDFSNKKLKKLYPDLNFKSHFIRNKSDLKLKTLFLICGTLLYNFTSYTIFTFKIFVALRYSFIRDNSRRVKFHECNKDCRLNAGLEGIFQLLEKIFYSTLSTFK